MKSLTIVKISEMSGLSVPKIRKSISAFRNLNYISEGVMQHNAKTYYVTEQGINKINSIL
jgi:DNA-binding transcriptional regulator GbsR (MarR family)